VWGQPQPWYGGWQPPRPLNGLAIAALVTGLVGLVPIAIGLGIAALVQISRRGHRGTGLAVGGMCAAGVWTVLIGLFLVAGFSGTFDYSREGDLADVASTTVGACLDEHPPVVTDCSTPHDLEVYYAPPLRASYWPGEEDVDSQADDLCYEAFDDYVGTSYDWSDYDYTFFAPSETEWLEGRHLAVCVITPLDDHLTGSVKGSGD
jgi:hypothetical protein